MKIEYDFMLTIEFRLMVLDRRIYLEHEPCGQQIPITKVNNTAILAYPMAMAADHKCTK